MWRLFFKCAPYLLGLAALLWLWGIYAENRQMRQQISDYRAAITQLKAAYDKQTQMQQAVTEQTAAVAEGYTLVDSEYAALLSTPLNLSADAQRTPPDTTHDKTPSPDRLNQSLTQYRAYEQKPPTDVHNGKRHDDPDCSCALNGMRTADPAVRVSSGAAVAEHISARRAVSAETDRRALQKLYTKQLALARDCDRLAVRYNALIRLYNAAVRMTATDTATDKRKEPKEKLND